MTIILGILAIGFGFYTLHIRKTDTDRFVKLRPMKKLYGDEKGDRLHFFFYTVAPFIIGVLLILKSFLGS